MWDQWKPHIEAKTDVVSVLASMYLLSVQTSTVVLQLEIYELQQVYGQGSQNDRSGGRYHYLHTLRLFTKPRLIRQETQGQLRLPGWKTGTPTF